MSATVQEFSDLFIGGEWIPAQSDGMLDVVSPATGEVIARVPEPTDADADAAVAAARKAFDEGPWPRMSPAERATYISALRDQFAERLDEFNAAWTAESGPTLAHGAGLHGAVLNVYEDLIARAHTLELSERRELPDGTTVEVIRDPVGVALTITTWNGPGLYVVMKIVPALLAGCTVIVKSAIESPLTSRLLGEMFAAAGFPPGVVSILAASTAVSEHLVTHPDVDKVSLTGSIVAGRRIMALCADRLANVTLELGGKSPAIIADDADLDDVMATLVPGFIAYNGQICAALTRVLVSRERYDEVVERLASALSEVRVGDPTDPTTDQGPLGSERQLERVEGYVRSGIEQGARVVIGGRRPPSLEQGFYYEPTIFADVTSDMTIAQEEIFGPVLSVIPYDTIEEAIQIANDTEYGLAGSVYTKDPDLARRVAREVQSGTFAINCAGVSLMAPFGGYKQSGFGRECGPEGLDEFLQIKSVLLGG